MMKQEGSWGLAGWGSPIAACLPACLPACLVCSLCRLPTPLLVRYAARKGDGGQVAGQTDKKQGLRNGKSKARAVREEAGQRWGRSQQRGTMESAMGCLVGIALLLGLRKRTRRPYPVARFVVQVGDELDAAAIEPGRMAPEPLIGDAVARGSLHAGHRRMRLKCQRQAVEQLVLERIDALPEQLGRLGTFLAGPQQGACAADGHADGGAG